mgnify:FL=1
MKTIRLFLMIVSKILFLPFSISWWLLKSNISASKADLSDFLSTPPILTGLPGDIEIKKMVRTKTGWRVHYGKRGQRGSQASAMLTPGVNGFTVNGVMVSVNGK